MVYKLMHRETKHKNRYFLVLISGVHPSLSVVSSSSDSADGNESDIDVQPNPPKKYCSSSISKPPTKSGSGITRYNKKWEEIFSWLEFDE